MLTIFEKIKQDKIDLTGFNEHQKSLIMAMLKLAFNDGINYHKQEIRILINSYLDSNI